MGSKPSGSQSTSVRPPKYLTPYLKDYASGLTDTFNQTTPEQFSPQFAPETLQAFQRTQQLVDDQGIPLQQRIENSFNQLSPQIQSRFALGGRRGGGLQQSALGDAFARVATDQFSQEQARQLGLNETLRSIGAERESLQQRQLRAPFDRYALYGGLLSGQNYGQTQSTPLFRGSPLMSGLGGAATGAALGSVVPGIGTGVGAGVGAGIGLLGGYL